MSRPLDPEIVRLAEEAARKPDYTEVLARGRTLARRRTAIAATATVVVVAGLLGATQLASRPRAVPVAPVVPVVPSPSPTASESPEPPEPPDATSTDPAGRIHLTAQQIVADPESRLVEVRSVPGDSGTRVALWRWCATESCQVRAEAVTLTSDDFTTSTVAEATWSNVTVRIANSGEVVVLHYRADVSMQVVRLDGSVVEVEKARAEAPVAEGEVVAGVDYQPTGSVFWATDPTSATAHEVPVPDGTQQLVQTAGGQLRALTVRRTYGWSDDGGTTWNESAGAGDEGLLYGFVTSTDDTHVVVGGGDGATLFPFSQIRRLDDWDSWSVINPGTDPMAYVGPTAVLPDGRFLASVEAWSDWRFDNPSQGTPPGLYLSDGDDWTTYTRVDSGAPFETPGAMQPQVVDLRVSDEGTVITAVGPDGATAWTSSDLGETWQELAVR